MKKILLLSDTHGFIDDQILKFVKQADEVWHAGDIGDIKVADAIRALKPLRAVYGNIDNAIIRAEFPLDNRFIIEKLDVWMTHIGGYPNRYESRVKADIQTKPPKLFISGHSHILKVINDKKFKLLHLNPGAAGKYGFHQVRTMLRFEIDNGRVENLEVIELGKRG
ncbi:MAG: metallophosphoesterase family protein [Aureibaculum sp.]